MLLLTFKSTKMSEISKHYKERQEKLVPFAIKILEMSELSKAVNENQDIIESIDYKDIIYLVHKLSVSEIPMEQLKTGINKILNLFYKSLNSREWPELKENEFFKSLLLNNSILDKKLKEIREYIKKINKTGITTELKNTLKIRFRHLLKYDTYYQLKENVIFPVLEKNFEEMGCLPIMWSFHDDIRRHNKIILEILEEENFDLEKFNKTSGKFFFNTYAIKFREEKILYPFLLLHLKDNELAKMQADFIDFKLPFAKIPGSRKQKNLNEDEEINLGSGYLTAKQISLVFNHLPVDITYVDENNKVRYFSTPKKRFFMRTNAIIGRDVKNCHPQESVHVVEKIVEAFRKGEKDRATFWINIKGIYLFIQYFAVRDEQNTFRGVVEVTQEINEIQEIKGERKLLSWDE